jgi:hypothetical protein
VGECDRGQRKALTCSDTVCSCGADHAALLREALSYQRASHPWEVEYQEWRRNLGVFLISEAIYQQELSRLDRSKELTGYRVAATLSWALLSSSL